MITTATNRQSCLSRSAPIEKVARLETIRKADKAAQAEILATTMWEDCPAVISFWGGNARAINWLERRGSRFVTTVESTIEVGASRVELVVLVEPLDLVEEPEALVDAARERDRHRAVQLDHRRRGDLGEAVVQHVDLSPRPILGMRGRDRSLELVLPRPAQRDRTLEHAEPLGDALSVPERSVLIGEQDELAVNAHTCFAP